MPDCLFVYGTLHPDRAPSEILPAVRQLQSLGPATVEGTLYRLRGYPGLLWPGPAPRTIAGELFRLPQAPIQALETLALLDAYEDFRPDEPADSLFLRVETEAVPAAGTRVSCWIYIYNRTLPKDLKPCDGAFAAHLFRRRRARR